MQVTVDDAVVCATMIGTLAANANLSSLKASASLQLNTVWPPNKRFAWSLNRD